jgi:hypothetical protein
VTTSLVFDVVSAPYSREVAFVYKLKQFLGNGVQRRVVQENDKPPEAHFSLQKVSRVLILGHLEKLDK